MPKRMERRNKTFRIGVPLLRRLERRAREEEISLNQLVDRLLESAVPDRAPLERMLEVARRADARRGSVAPRERQFSKDELHEDDR